MYGPMEGEFIARVGSRLNVRDGPVQEPYEGCLIQLLRFGAIAG